MAVSLTATLDTVSVPPRVVLTVAGAGAAVSATIVCNEGTVRPVRGAEPLTLSGGGGVAFDYEVPRDVSLTWTVTTSLPEVASSSAVTVPSNDEVWLLHPGAPGLSVKIKGDPIPSFSSNMQSAVYSPLGRSEGVYFSTGSDSATGTVTAWTETFAETQSFLTLARSGFPVRLLAPAAFMDSAPYLGFLNARENRLSRKAWDQSREVVADFQIVARPISALQLIWVYSLLNSTYATYTALNAAYAGKTYIDLAIGPA